MSTKFLFEVYVKVRNVMSAFKNLRRQRGGIMIDNDGLAIMYRRRLRLAKKLEKRILDNLPDS